MKIENLEVENRVFLAPMLEPNDIAFRMLCKKAGAGLTYTGMVSPLSKQKIFFDDKPAVQLFGNTNKGIKEFIKKYDKKVSLWDFNLGCPSKLSKKPISIKLRKSPQAIEIAKMAEKYVDAIGIHPRTLEQGYSGSPDYEFALKLKDSVKVPVIYSGDIHEKEIKKVLKDFDYVFIGRAAMGNPGIFGREQSFEDYLELAIKYDLPFRQIKYQAMLFTKGKKRAKRLRAKLMEAKTIEEIKQLFK